MTAPPRTKLVLVVIDGLTPRMLEASLGDRSLTPLWALAEHGRLGRGTTPVPTQTSATAQTPLG